MKTLRRLFLFILVLNAFASMTFEAARAQDDRPLAIVMNADGPIMPPMLEKERCWHVDEVLLCGGDATARCFIVALDDDKIVAADERMMVEECRGDDAREARAPIFLHAVDENMMRTG